MLEVLKVMFPPRDDVSFWTGYASGAIMAAILVVVLPLLGRLWHRIMG